MLPRTGHLPRDKQHSIVVEDKTIQDGLYINVKHM